jgi:hypothetical protein
MSYQLSACNKRTHFFYKKTFSGGTLFEERNVAHDCVSNDLELPAPSPPPPLIFVFMVYTVKKVSDFHFPSRDITIQTLPGRELLNYSRPGRVFKVTSRLGRENRKPFFYSVEDEIRAEVWVFPQSHRIQI